MSAQTLLTLEQFSKMPEYDEKNGNRYEFDHGELIELLPEFRVLVDSLFP